MNLNTCVLEPFEKKSKIALKLFNQIDDYWLNNGGDKPIAQSMKHKIFHEKKFKIYPYILFDSGTPVAITWVELSTQYYGNITAFFLDDIYTTVLVKLLRKKLYFENKIMELVAINHMGKFKDACYKNELIPNIRKRMYLWLNNCDYYHQTDHPFEFKLYTPDYYDWSAKLSVESHNISKDYIYYQEMIHPEKRKGLEEIVLKGTYGKIIQPASLVIYYNNKPVGFCLVVEVECWGYKTVPWIFDICIDPSFHGQGLGKALSKEMLNILIEMNYEIMGLAVTLTNKYAIKMYSNLGFLDLDVFYEFIDPT